MAPAHPFLDQSLGLRSLQHQVPGISSGMAGLREVKFQLMRWYFPFESSMERTAGTAKASCPPLSLGGRQMITY